MSNASSHPAARVASRPGPITWVVVTSAVAYLLAQVALVPGTGVHDAVYALGFLPIQLACAVGFYRAAKLAIDPVGRRGFRFFALSFAATAAGTVFSGVQQFLLQSDPIYSWPNLAFLASYPAAMLGVLAFQTRRPSPADRWRMAIDTAIAVTAAMVVSWIYIAGPLASDAQTPGQLALLFAFPIGDLVLFAALVPVLLAPREPKAARVLRLLAAGQMVYLAGDLSYQLPNATIPGLLIQWADAVFIAGYAGMAWAIDTFVARPITLQPHAPVVDLSPGRRNLLIIGLGLVVYTLLLLSAVRPWNPPQSLLAVTTVVVTLLILVRERVTEGENLRLAGALEAERGAARFRNSIRHLRVGVIVQDAEGRVRIANPAAQAMLGLEEPLEPDQRPFGPDWSVTKEDGSPILDRRDPGTIAIAAGTPLRNLVLGVTPPGSRDRRWLLVDADPTIGPTGAVEEVVVSYHDITEHRNLEEQLRQSQRMEAVGQLAGGVAHDFNNLLTAIIGHAAIIRSAVGPNSPAADDALEIRKAADRAARLTKQLLAFSRRQLLRPEVLDLNEVVAGTERLLERLVGEDIEMVTLLAKAPLPVLVDRGQLEQVIVNLVVNARDAMPRGGRLEIVTAAIDPAEAAVAASSFTTRHGIARLEVRDVGHGMDEATQARAFEPFFTTKEVGKGTGLGLSTVYGIVRQSGGDVRIESKVGHGTTVVVDLPRTAAVAEPAIPTPPIEPPPGRETVLVVEDEAALRRVVRQSLGRRGYRVLEAASLAEARVVFERQDSPVNLLLADVVMPGGNGPELAAWAQARDPRLRVILMTGYADEATLRYGLDASHADLLQKPFDPDQLATLIRTALDRHREPG